LPPLPPLAAVPAFESLGGVLVVQAFERSRSVATAKERNISMGVVIVRCVREARSVDPRILLRVAAKSSLT
jgi:hypothetical protein